MIFADIFFGATLSKRRSLSRFCTCIDFRKLETNISCGVSWLMGHARSANKPLSSLPQPRCGTRQWETFQREGNSGAAVRRASPSFPVVPTPIGRTATHNLCLNSLNPSKYDENFESDIDLVLGKRTQHWRTPPAGWHGWVDDRRGKWLIERLWKCCVSRRLTVESSSRSREVCKCDCASVSGAWRGLPRDQLTKKARRVLVNQWKMCFQWVKRKIICE